MPEGPSAASATPFVGPVPQLGSAVDAEQERQPGAGDVTSVGNADADTGLDGLAQPETVGGDTDPGGTDDSSGAPAPDTSATGGAPSASVHADTNHGTLIGQLFEAVQRHSGAPLPPAVVDQDLADYVSVLNEDRLAQLLEDNRVVVLVADRLGSGRWTTALRLLTTRPGDSLTLRRIRRESGDAFNMEGLKGHKRTGWILDLRAAEEALPASCDFGLELLHSDDLRADGSYLVVVVGTALWRDVRGVAGDLARPPQPPDSVTLFQKFLQSAKLANPEAWAADTRIGEQLSGLLPGQVRAWAKTFVRTESEYRVATGHSTAPGSKGFDAVIKAASNAVAGWMDVLTNWHSHPGRTSYDRNYLLLAAVYDGEPVDSIHEKIASLSRALGEKNDEVQRLSGQQGPGLIQLANQAESEVLPDGRLRFPGPGFAEAVVRYFLLDRPELIERFTTWTAQLCVDLPAPKAEKVAERLSPWILHHVQVARSMRVLLGVAASWSADKTLRKHAHALLVTAALDPEVGQLTRNATSKWIEKENAPLLQTLAQVFQSVTPAHPVQMIRRLGDLAGSLDRRERLDAKEKLDVANAVGAAIDALWEDDKLRPQLRKTLNSWFTSGHEGQRQAAASAFMYLAMQQEGASGTPTLLCGAASSVEDWVVSGWRIALEVEEPTSLTRQACAAWLDTATARPSASDRILSVLVRAVHDTPTDHLRGQRFLNLVRIAEYWLERGEVGNRQDRNRFRSVLMQRAQQADPHQPRVHDEAETSGV